MKRWMSVRALVVGIFAALAAGLAPWSAQAAEGGYPSRPVRMIVPFAPGGGADFIARTIAEKLGARTGQPFVIDYRGGAGGAVGTEVAAKSAPDGYTIIMVSNGYAVNPAVATANYDPLNDMVPIVRAVDASMVLAVNTSLPVTDLKSFIAYAKNNPGKLSFGSSGVGGISHLAAEEFFYSAGLKALHIPYRGTGPANAALLAGEIQVNVADIALIAPMTRTGRVKALFIGSKTRSKLLPDVPAAAEAGFPNSKLGIWYGVLAPHGTPAAVVARLNREINAILATPEVVEAFAARFAAPAGGTAEEFGENIRADYAFWKSFSERTGLKVQ